MFKGTPTRTAAEISEAFDRLGAELNAFTGKEYTCYYARVLDEHVPIAVEVLSDMVVNSRAGATTPSATSARSCIEEIARTEDTPDDRSCTSCSSGTLWPSHPLGLPVLGSRETVGGFDNAQSRAFHDAPLPHRPRSSWRPRATSTTTTLVELVEKYLALPEGRATSASARRRRRSDTRLQVLTQGHRAGAHLLGRARAQGHRRRPLRALASSTSSSAAACPRGSSRRSARRRAWRTRCYSYHSLYQDTGAVRASTRARGRPTPSRSCASCRPRSRTCAATASPPRSCDRAKEAHQGSARAVARVARATA